MSVSRRRKTRPKETLLTWFAAHQIEVSSAPLLVILLANVLQGYPTFSLKPLHPLHFPSLDPTYHVESLPARFLLLSYRDPKTGLCLKGGHDFLVVVTWVLVWTFLREASMRWLFAPLARAWGIRRESLFRTTLLMQSLEPVDVLKRFCEQGWGLSYACFSCMYGLAILENSPYKSKTFVLMPSDEYYRGYPHFSLLPTVKFYYLIQIAFWVATLLALNIEKRRKDFLEMFAHHVITIGLLASSYATNFTRIGSLIMVQMDLVDIVLPLAKMSKYLGFTWLPDLLFGIFLITWIATRHVFFTMTVWSVIFSPEMHRQYNWDPPAGKFLNAASHSAFISLLLGLQAILFAWLYSIIRVIIKVVSGSSAEDIRSDAESGPEELEEETKSAAMRTEKTPNSLRKRQRG